MFTIVVFVLIVTSVRQSSAQSEQNSINRVDFIFDQFHRQRTVQYYDDHSGVSNVIIRRGENFKFAVELNQLYSSEQIVVQLTFATRRGQLLIELPSSKHYGWTLKQSAAKRSIRAEMHIPGNAPIGRWSMQIVLKNSVGDVIEQYETPHKIVILCNPWSTEDAVYFPDANKLNEYVLNEKGLIYTYNFNSWSSIPWIFGQFQSEVLDAVLFVLERAQLTPAERGNVVLVARELTYLMNDDGLYNRGVLQGKWEKPWGPIDGRQSTKPWEWIGSPAILKTYYWTKGLTVGYGQCWVYAGILTTVYRALGIPARPVSNFLSAHDQGIDLTLDIYLDEDGYKKKSSDVLWNFHVWVQAWFSRRNDMGRAFDGWQELDSTPQRLNDDKYQVGPASTIAVRSVTLKNRFEAPYFYSTVNADEVTYSSTNEIISIKRDKVGLAVMTKAVGRDAPENIVSIYKPRENTTLERESYKKAAQVLGLHPVSLNSTIIAGRAAKKNVLISIKMVSQVKIGSTILAEIFVRNPSLRTKLVKFGIKATAMYYNGRESKVVKLNTHKFVLKGLMTHRVKFAITSDEYIDQIEDSNTFRIEAVAKTDAIKGLDYTAKWLSLLAPVLTVKAPESVNVNQTFPLHIQLTNPFNRKLSNCHVVLEGTRLERRVFKVPDIPANATGRTTLHLRSTHPLLESIVASFYANNLRDVYGSITLKVVGKRRHKFAVYSLKPGFKPKYFKTGTRGGLQKITRENFRCCNYIEYPDLSKLPVSKTTLNRRNI